MKWIYLIFFSIAVYFCSMALWSYQNLNAILFNQSALFSKGAYFKSGTTSDEINSLKAQLNQNWPTLRARIWSPKDQYNEFIEGAALEGAIDAEEIVQTLPYYLEVESSNKAELAQVVTYLQEQSGIIESLIDANSWTQKFSAIVLAIDSLGKIFFLFIFLIVCFLSLAAVRFMASERRNEYAIRSFLGEDLLQTLRPLFTEILIVSFLGTAIGFALTFLSYWSLKLRAATNVDLFFINQRIEFITWSNAAILTAGLLFALLIALTLSFKSIEAQIYDS
jgi:cell division protein FtsX